MTEIIFLFFLLSGILFWAFIIYIAAKIWFEK